jgi:hypothetical protein
MEPPPSGVVTCLFTDVEGSARLWESDDPGMARAAALVLGGMTRLTSSTPDTPQVIPRASAALEQELGDEFPISSTRDAV